jgi:glutamate 5-kinase
LRRTNLINESKRVVIKVGSAVLFHAGCVDCDTLSSLCDDIVTLIEGGREVAVVSSGAIACGVERLGLKKRPDTLPDLQAAAAVGQSVLMQLYDQALSRRGYHCGQMLLTREDFADRTRYLNASNTLRALLALKAVPIINENDTIAVDEIRFGENDVLSAYVANIFEADLLVILSTVAGLHEDFADKGRDGRVIPEVEGVDEAVSSMATCDKSSVGSGGMVTKLEAARIVTRAGEAALVACGREPNVLRRIFAGEKVGTLFYPTHAHLAGRKRWIGYGARAKGEITVDDGAARALKNGGKSLLPSGIVAISGDFASGDVVGIRAQSGPAFARGIVSYSSKEVRSIKGLKTSQIAGVLGSKPYDEVVHRDVMTLL